MNTFVLLVRNLSKMSGIVAAILIISAIIVVCQMVFIRYVLNMSTIWQTDFVTYSLVASVFLGAPFVAQKKGHVNVDLLPMYASPKWKIRLEYICIFISFSFSLILAITGWELWYEAWEGNWLSETIWEIPMWIPYLALPIGMSLMSLEYFADAISLKNDSTVPLTTESGDNL